MVQRHVNAVRIFPYISYGWWLTNACVQRNCVRLLPQLKFADIRNIRTNPVPLERERDIDPESGTFENQLKIVRYVRIMCEIVYVKLMLKRCHGFCRFSFLLSMFTMKWHESERSKDRNKKFSEMKLSRMKKSIVYFVLLLSFFLNGVANIREKKALTV